ncbi:MAG: cell division protein FtsA [bacterium]|nr:cell division protein FtsA [bacterium]
MQSNELPHFCGIDIGTSSVRCVVGAVNNAGEPEIIGFGSSPNNGMRKGVVVMPEEVGNAILQAVEEASRHSGRDIRHATVNINGSHVTGSDSRGVIAISAANREITVDDRNRVEDAATIMQLPANREIIQVFPKSYRLDGQENIKNPVGMRGVRLEVDTHIVTASTPSVRSAEAALHSAGIDPAHKTVSSLAAAEAVMSRQQKEAGTVLLDIGAGTTNLVVIEEGEVQHVSVLPVGGNNITNDLAIGLKTDLDIAERVKLEFVSLGSHRAKAVAAVVIDGKQHTFAGDEVSMIVNARVEELFELVDKELKSIHKSRKLPGGVVITGGTSKIPGIEELARDKLELSSRVGKVTGVGGIAEITADSSNTAAVGLVLLDMLLTQHDSSDYDGGSGLPNIGSIGNLFKRFNKKK